MLIFWIHIESIKHTWRLSASHLRRVSCFMSSSHNVSSHVLGFDFELGSWLFWECCIKIVSRTTASVANCSSRFHISILSVLIIISIFNLPLCHHLKLLWINLIWYDFFNLLRHAWIECFKFFRRWISRSLLLLISYRI